MSRALYANEQPSGVRLSPATRSTDMDANVGIPVTDVTASAAYAYTEKDVVAVFRQIPSGGVAVQLPAKAFNGDRYEGADGDGTCTSGSPIVLTAAAGQTIRGLASLSFAAAYSWYTATFSDGTWLVESGVSFNPNLVQSAWWQDYVAGDDRNPGTQVAPVKTLAEIYRRWQGFLPGTRPTLPISTTIHMVSPVPVGDFGDPVLQLAEVNLAAGVTVSVVPASQTILRTGQLNSIVTPFARTPTGRLTVTDAGVADWTPFFDQLVLDLTTNSVSWVTAIAGETITQGIWQPPRPTINPSSPPITGMGAVTTTGATDHYQIIAPLSVYFGSGSVTRQFPTSTVAGTSNFVLYALHGVKNGVEDVMNVTADGVSLGGISTPAGAVVSFCQCKIDPIVVSFSGGVVFANCSFGSSVWLSGDLTQSSVLYGGYARHDTFLLGCGLVDQDFQILGAEFIVDGSIGFGNDISCAGVYSTGGASEAVFIGGTLQFSQGVDAVNPQFYGNIGTEVFSLSQFAVGPAVIYDVSAASAFDFDTNTFHISGATSGFGFDATTGLFVGPTTFTFPHLDAALGAATGFGGSAQNPVTGGRVMISA